MPRGSLVSCWRHPRWELPCPGERRAGVGGGLGTFWGPHTPPGLALWLWGEMVAGGPLGAGGRRNSHHFECLARAQAVSPWEMEVVWESAPEIQAGGNLALSARELEVTGLTVHDKSVFFFL